MSEAQSLNNILAIRYDYSVKEYTEGVHPVSHFHFGIDNKVKLPLKTLLTPTMFGIFILKQVYYDNWQKLFAKKPVHFVGLLEKSKGLCPEVHPEYFKGFDFSEFYLV